MKRLLLPLACLISQAWCDPGASVSMHAGRYEASGYGNFTSYGKNFALLSDFDAGIRLTPYLNLDITTNLGYRNYSLASNDYASLTYRKEFQRHGLLIGPIAGIYTLWLSHYHIVIPGYGLEFVYAYTRSPGISIRLKERLFEFSENGRRNQSTATLVGFCFAFGGPAD